MSDEPRSSEVEGTYVVTLVGESRVFLSQPFRLDFPAFAHPMSILLLMREKALPGFERPVPQQLGAQVRVQASSLDQAVGLSTGVVNVLTAFLSCAANASIDEMSLHVAYDATPARQARAFYQVIDPDRFLVTEWRVLSEADVIAPLRRWLEDPLSARLQRAALHYHRALLHWTDRGNPHSLNHIWIAAESLTDVLLKRECAARGVSKNKLSRLWKLDKKKSLEVEIRTRLIFDGDSDLHRDLKTASDGYEHGFATLEETGAIAARITRRAAALVRRAILRVLSDAPDGLKLLTSDEFAAPLGLRRRDVLTATLRGPGDQLANDGQLVPFFTFQGKLEENEPLGAVPMRVKNTLDFTPQLPAGTTASDLRLGRLT